MERETAVLTCPICKHDHTAPVISVVDTEQDHDPLLLEDPESGAGAVERPGAAGRDRILSRPHVPPDLRKEKSAAQRYCRWAADF